MLLPFEPSINAVPTILTTSPSSVAVAVTNIAIVNDTSSAATATINLATIPLVSSISLPANSTQFIDLEQIIYNGETMFVFR